MNRRLAWVALLSGGLILAAAVAALRAGLPAAASLFYLFAWCPTLLIVEGLCGLSGGSLLLDAPRRYARLALVSIPFWLFYEALNLRLRNWEYWDIAQPLWVRWPGYTMAFATVLPIVLRIAGLLERLLPRAWHSRRLPGLLEPWALAWMRDAGWACLMLVLLWPGLFFPLAWAPAFLWLEPELASTRPDRSWLRALGEGRPQRTYALLLAGLVTGLLWESLNYWAGGKWKYTVPWPKEPKLFEMPWLGFVGFLPFALGCASFWGFFEARWAQAGPTRRRAWTAALAAFSLLVFAAMDRWTVRSFSPPW